MARKTSDYPHDLLIALKQLQAFNDCDELAEFFEERGIKGDPGIVSSCPIAIYLWQNCDGQLYDVIVNDSSITFQFPEEKEVNDPYHEVGCTSAMSSFIGLFDNHCYKNLERDYDYIPG